MLRHCPAKVTRTAMAASVALFCLAGAAFSQSESEPVADVPVRPSLAVLPSNSGLFQIVSPSSVTNYMALKWAEEVAERFERSTGLKLDRSLPGLSIALRADPGDGRVLLRQPGARPYALLGLVIVNMERVDKESAHEALCYLLLERQIRARRIETEDGEAPVPVLPGWFSEGLAQNLHPTLRERNRMLIKEKWQNGELAPLLHLVDFEAERQTGGAAASSLPQADLLHRAVYGVFTAWLLSAKPRSDAIGQIIERLARGEPITAAWLADYMPGCAGRDDVDAAWDQWLLRQDRIIGRPGQATSKAVDQLRVALLLYTGHSGIPLRDGKYERMELRGLIEQRKAAWLPDLCREKCAVLRLLAVGRGQHLGEVSAAYCAFFEALAARKRPGRLERLLAEAETALVGLEQELEQVGTSGE